MRLSIEVNFSSILHNLKNDACDLDSLRVSRLRIVRLIFSARMTDSLHLQVSTLILIPTGIVCLQCIGQSSDVVGIM